MRWFALFAVVTCACSTGSGGGSNDGGSDTSIAPSGSEQLCVDTINMYRATLGLTPYQRWADQESCASAQAKSDSMTMKAHGAFGVCTENAQNECPNWSGPPEMLIKGCLASMWAEGPGTDFATHGHWINMSSKTYTKVACGFFQMANGKWWSVQDFR